MAITNYYVAPSSGNDTTGNGLTDGTAWATVQKALDTITQGAGGDRINVKNDSGVDDVLTAALNLTTYGTPSATQPLVIQGYTSTVGDGGKGGIDGDATYSIMIETAANWVHFIDMHLHNTGAAQVLHLNNDCGLIRCEVDNSSYATRSIDFAGTCTVVGCHIHNLAGNAGLQVSGGMVGWNYFEDGTNKFVTACDPGGATFCFNIIHLNSVAGNGMIIPSGPVFNNSIYNAAAGTGRAMSANTSSTGNFIMNNYIEGFSDTGGDGIFYNATTRAKIQGNNKTFNCDVDFTPATEFTLDDFRGTTGTPTDAILGSSPFTSAGTDFSPVTKETALPDNFGDGGI